VEAAARHKHQLLSRAVSLDRTAVAYTYTDSARDPLELDLVDTLVADDPDGDPESRLLARDELDRLLEALPALTPSERLAVAGMLSGESYQCLARARGSTPKAASQAAYRARRKLAAELTLDD
jgi:DNA-directed RNA polymerase specialized sigma24 family protein